MDYSQPLACKAHDGVQEGEAGTADGLPALGHQCETHRHAARGIRFQRKTAGDAFAGGGKDAAIRGAARTLGETVDGRVVGDGAPIGVTDVVGNAAQQFDAMPGQSFDVSIAQNNRQIPELEIRLSGG